MLSKLVNNISQISVNSLAQKVFKESGISKFIINLNREDQLFLEGVGVDGKIVAEYSFDTQILSQGISGKGFPKRAGDPFNFYSTGEMYNSFSIRIERDGFVINADTSDLLSNEKNRKRIGSDKKILGLTNESKAELVEKIIPLLVKELRIQALK
jgi:hypothetical protein